MNEDTDESAVPLRRVREAELTVTYEDGSTERLRWLGDVHPVDLGIEFHGGWPKAQLGGVTVTVSRWPALHSQSPVTGRSDGA